ncbi:Fis family transcriptional regulator [Nocardioides baekrokdamisoli]|uniref:Fis family transcriptional regulator n=1 Tax=Nocardioides baekrokdamisoli TaxID=1804624 RepID=A0A3G9IWN4_9ACTN|nr:PucR family transcriptional regulator [Nocardioides baekrokdamisoli]BBH16763.1 Fis family transcriptional regulator [Nocardioides baekrokdamisoli]
MTLVVKLAVLLDDRTLGLRPLVDVRRSEEIAWSATSELTDPSPFLGQGEVLLTTGLETVGWLDEWDSYVARIAAVGVLAIGLAVDLTYATAPPALIEACAAYDVGLFEVPRETTFVAVTRQVARLLQAEDESSTRAALGQQRELTQAALREDEPELLIEAVARVGQAAALVDPEGAVLVGPAGVRTDLLAADAIAEALNRIRDRGLRAAAGMSVSGGEILLHPLGVRGRPERYLVTAFEQRVTEDQRSSIVTAVALLSTSEERRRSRREAERQVRARAVELLIAGDTRTASVLLAAAGGGRLRVPSRVAVLRTRGAASRIEAALAQVESTALAGVVAAEAGEMVIVARQSRVDALVEDLAARGLRVGVGDLVPVADAARSDRAAGLALDLTTVDRAVVRWVEGVRRGVLEVLDSDRLSAFADTWLAPLDPEPELLATLRSFLAHHGSQLQVAEDLGIHRNTVRKRLDRIESLLDSSLADPQTRADGWIALQARAQ